MPQGARFRKLPPRVVPAGAITRRASSCLSLHLVAHGPWVMGVCHLWAMTLQKWRVIAHNLPSPPLRAFIPSTAHFFLCIYRASTVYRASINDLALYIELQPFYLSLVSVHALLRSIRTSSADMSPSRIVLLPDIFGPQLNLCVLSPKPRATNCVAKATQ